MRRTIGQMRDISYVVAFFAALFLFTAAAAWWKIYQDPKDDLTVGGTELDPKRMRSAARLTAAAFGLCGLAAFLAVLDWFLRQMMAY